MSKYTYAAFGLTIRSDIECEDLLPATGAPDVDIRWGCVPDALQHPNAQGVLYEISFREFLLSIGRVGRYLVSGGNQILIDPAPEADLSAIKLFLFGSAFGALLHQRGILPLHGSAIVTSRGAVIIAGASGCGKSTLACAFHRKGYPVLADDVCAIQMGTPPAVLPGSPYLVLWADTLRRLGVDQPGLRLVRPELEKYILPLREGFANEAVELRAIYILSPVNSELSAPIPVKGLAKIEALTQNIYRRSFVEDMNIRAAQIRQITEVARGTPVRFINRPIGSFQLEELVSLLERDFRG